MKIIEGKESEYTAWKAKNSTDAYSAECFRYAEAWADLIEAKIAAGKTLQSVAEKTSHNADTSGITGFMYGMAVSILSQMWIHGEELRRWHNKDIQHGNEGDKANEEGGVLNPACLSVTFEG